MEKIGQIGRDKPHVMRGDAAHQAGEDGREDEDRHLVAHHVDAHGPHRGLEARARLLGCDVVALDSGTQRTAAHRFYFREGFVIPSFCFRKSLS